LGLGNEPFFLAGRDPHLTLTLSPPTGLHRGHQWERRGNNGRSRNSFWRSQGGRRFQFARDFRTAQRVGGRLPSGSGCRGFSSGRARVYTFFLCGLHGEETNAKKHSIGLILLGILNFWLRKRARRVRATNCTHWREFSTTDGRGWTRIFFDRMNRISHKASGFAQGFRRRLHHLLQVRADCCDKWERVSSGLADPEWDRIDRTIYFSVSAG
jgi:hypothetical protein